VKRWATGSLSRAFLIGSEPGRPWPLQKAGFALLSSFLGFIVHGENTLVNQKLMIMEEGSVWIILTPAEEVLSDLVHEVSV
jgi:hypothetical protein